MRLRLGSALARYHLVYIVVFPSSHGAGVLFDFCEREDDYYLLESDAGDLFGVFESFPAFCINVEGEGLEEITWYAIFLYSFSGHEANQQHTGGIRFELRNTADIIPQFKQPYETLGTSYIHLRVSPYALDVRVLHSNEPF